MFMSVAGIISVSADTQQLNDTEILMAGLGVIDLQDYNPSQVMSRAEFAEIICKVLGVSSDAKSEKEWADYVYDGIVVENELNFSDVDVSHPNYEAIKEIYFRGYMRGITDTHFAPNHDMTEYAAVKVLVDMLGYGSVAQTLGGWPNGYLSIARKNGLLKSVAVSEKGVLTYSKALELIYQAMEIDVMETSAFGPDGSEDLESVGTFLTEVMGLDVAEGILTDNGITSVSGATKLSSGKVVVDGVTLTVTKECEYVLDYIGREVIAYYKNEENAKKEIVYAYVSSESDVIEFDVSDFVSFSASEITYVDENEKIKTEKIDKNAAVIYNGVYTSRYDKSIFDFDFGNIALVATGDSSQIDLIVINDYRIGVVTKYVAGTSTLYCENIYGDSFIKSLNLEEGNVYDKVSIKDATGKSISENAITADSVVSVKKSADNSYLEVIVSSAKKTDYTFDALSQDGEDLELSGESGAFVFKAYSSLKDKPTLEYGKAYKLYFTHKGELVWIDADTTPGKKMGILIETSVEGGLEDKYLVKIYGADGVFEILTLGENVEVNNETKKTKNIFDTITASCEQAVLYTTDSEGKKLKSITFALAYGAEDTDNRGWYHVSSDLRLKRNPGETDAQWKAYRDANKLQYQTNGSTFKKYLVYDKNITNIFTMPDDESYYNDERKFSVNKFSFANSASYLFDSYATDSKAVVPDMIVLCQAASGSGSIKAKIGILVERISNGVDEDGEEVMIIKGYEFNQDKSTVSACQYPVDSDVVFLGAGEVGEQLNPETSNILTDGASKMEDIEPGDIIRVETNSFGTVVAIRTAYDMSTGVAFASGQGSTGVSGYLTDASANISAGYPVYVWDTFVRISEISPDEMNFEDPEQLRRLMGVRTKKGTVYVVNSIMGKIMISEGTLDDIVTYEDTGDASICDKVAVMTYWGLPVGTVVYKK